MTDRSQLRSAFLTVSFALLASASCVEDRPQALRILVVSGDSQTGFALEELPTPVVVEVVDSGGGAVRGASVTFLVTEGDGNVFLGTSITDSNGTARERWTLGPATGMAPAPQALEARMLDARTGEPVTARLTAAAIARPPAGLAYSLNPATYVAGAPVTENRPTHAGGAAVLYTVSPSLPEGLHLDPSTGIVSGTPTTMISGAYCVTAANSGGQAEVTLQLTVEAPPPPVIVRHPEDLAVRRGRPATFSVVASGTGTLGYQWRVEGAAIDGATVTVRGRTSGRAEPAA